MNESENTLAMEMTKVDNRSLSDFEMFHEKLETLLHPKHYLMIMLKRHLVQLYSSVLAQLDDEDLERVNCNFILFISSLILTNILQFFKK